MDKQLYEVRVGEYQSPRNVTVNIPENNKPEDIENAGVKFDQDKLPVHLLPFDALMEISEILAFGAKKYESRNWERGMDWHRPFRACTTHLWKWFMKIDDGKGPGMDEETGRSHLSHAGCCILFLIAYELRKIGKDTRP
jgi:hypothetical protein